MSDKTALGISEELRQFIEALVEEVVLEGKPFEDHKKYLQRFCEAESIEYESLERDLRDFFEILDEWMSLHTRGSQIAASMLGKKCYLTEEEMNKLFSVKSNRRKGGGFLDGHEYVDLGLPSGTLWATCNVGASVPECFGNHYAWGELEEKEVYGLNTYNHGAGTWNSLRDIGENISGTQFDVAHIKWGGKWRMPSIEQIDALLECCVIKVDGNFGFNFISKKNGNSIYLPLCGTGTDDNYYSMSTYWTGNKDGQGDAHCLFLDWDADMEDENGMCLRDSYRIFYGGSIRPVALL